jgi:hypothetical protein
MVGKLVLTSGISILLRFVLNDLSGAPFESSFGMRPCLHEKRRKWRNIYKDNSAQIETNKDTLCHVIKRVCGNEEIWREIARDPLVSIF